MKDNVKFIAELPCWQGSVTIAPLTGGITNVNFVIEDGSEKYVVRIGEDIPLHQVMRFNELSASRAAFEVGLSPEVIYHEKGALVLRYIEGKTLTDKDVQDQKNLQRILPLIQKCHHDVARHIRGPILAFWVFHILRDYVGTLRAGNSVHKDKLAGLLEKSEMLEKAVGPVDMVFGHNDLLPANFMDDGSRLWLIDWDYGGFNSPLFDLGGLASNNNLSENQEKWLLESYFDTDLKDELWRQYNAMKCASLLREAMWSMVSELHSQIDFDFSTYTTENLHRFDASMISFNALR